MAKKRYQKLRSIVTDCNTDTLIHSPFKILPNTIQILIIKEIIVNESNFVITHCNLTAHTQSWFQYAMVSKRWFGWVVSMLRCHRSLGHPFYNIYDQMMHDSLLTSDHSSKQDAFDLTTSGHAVESLHINLCNPPETEIYNSHYDRKNWASIKKTMASISSLFPNLIKVKLEIENEEDYIDINHFITEDYNNNNNNKTTHYNTKKIQLHLKLVSFCENAITTLMETLKWRQSPMRGVNSGGNTLDQVDNNDDGCVIHKLTTKDTDLSKYLPLIRETRVKHLVILFQRGLFTFVLDTQQMDQIAHITSSLQYLVSLHIKSYVAEANLLLLILQSCKHLRSITIPLNIANSEYYSQEHLELVEYFRTQKAIESIGVHGFNAFITGKEEWYFLPKIVANNVIKKFKLKDEILDLFKDSNGVGHESIKTMTRFSKNAVDTILSNTGITKLKINGSFNNIVLDYFIERSQQLPLHQSLRYLALKNIHMKDESPYFNGRTILKLIETFKHLHTLIISKMVNGYEDYSKVDEDSANDPITNINTFLDLIKNIQKDKNDKIDDDKNVSEDGDIFSSLRYLFINADKSQHYYQVDYARYKNTSIYVGSYNDNL